MSTYGDLVAHSGLAASHRLLLRAVPDDAVVLGDVLEHLRDPCAVLAWAVARLREGGIAVVSVPNAVHWTARREIARGRFPLRDTGTFDRTHLRWFTRARAHELLRSAGLSVEREEFTPAPLPGALTGRATG